MIMMMMVVMMTLMKKKKKKNNKKMIMMMMKIWIGIKAYHESATWKMNDSKMKRMMDGRTEDGSKKDGWMDREWCGWMKKIMDGWREVGILIHKL